MKYTIEGFSQAKLIEFNLDNTDALILRWFVDFLPKMITIEVEGNRYQWVKYSAVIEDLPCIGINNPQVMGRRFEKLVVSGIMDKHLKKEGGSFTCFKLNNKYLELVGALDAKVEGLTQKLTPLDAKVEPPLDAKVEPKDSSINKDSSIKLINNKSNIFIGEIIDYFNKITNRNVKGSKEIIKNINTLSKDYTIEDFKKVIDYISSSKWHIDNGFVTLSTICHPTKFYDKLEKSASPRNKNIKDTLHNCNTEQVFGGEF